MNLRPPNAPPILYGAYALAGLSLIWSGYAITDLMHSGRFGLSVAVAGDIGWITIMWAEHKRRGGIPVIVAGWVIAVGVGFLLVLHGVDENSVPQAIAGPFVVLVAKGVATVALLVTRDPAALTDAQEAEINSVIRDGEHQARVRAALRENAQRAADDKIALIEQEARITMARDRADFRITLDRIEMRAEIERCSPLAITAEVVREQDREPYRTTEPAHVSERPEPPVTSTNTDREQPSITELAREQVANTPDNALAIRAVLALRPDANEQSVAATVRRVRKQLDARGGYR